MKLSHYIQKNIAWVLLLVSALWSMFFYFAIISEVNDETDDSLENYRTLLIQKAMKDSTMLSGNYTNDIMTKHFIREIDYSEWENYQEHFSDSLVFYQDELEYDPVRVLSTAFQYQDGRCFELVVMTSILEKDDMVTSIFFCVLILYVVQVVSILVICNLVLRRSFQPFNKILEWMSRFRLGESEEPLPNLDLEIAEFKNLYDSVEEMSDKNKEIFLSQKQFIENASHELQTPLAICRNKLELMAESGDCTEGQMEQIGDIYQSIERIIRLNKTLLFLSKIENHQYNQLTQVRFNPILKKVLSDIEEIYDEKVIEGIYVEEGEFEMEMDEHLARSLVQNLIKNAFLHNKENGYVKVYVAADRWSVTNSGKGEALNEATLFDRFAKSSTKNSDSNGLGLSIVKSIAQLYDLDVRYLYTEEGHCFEVSKC